MDNDGLRIEEVDELSESKEKVALGVLGALLFSLIGCIFWVVLYYYTFFAPICGIAIFVFAIIGYRLFAKKASTKSIVVAFAVAFVAVLVSCYLSLAIDVYYAYQDWYEQGETDLQVSLFQALRYSYQFYADSGVLLSYLKEFGLGMVFCILGAAAFIIDAVKKHRDQKYY